MVSLNHIDDNMHRSARVRPDSFDQLMDRFRGQAGTTLSRELDAVTGYAGASAFLLMRADFTPVQRLENVIASNWPFDLVRALDNVLAADFAQTAELEKCMQTFQPRYALLPDHTALPKGISMQICWLTFCSGAGRYILAFLSEMDVALSNLRLRHAALLASYLVNENAELSSNVQERLQELTERELECLYWIAEGKTSDEIAVILGISRNTINNYITSVMRKTATRNRSEAIAFAVRHNLV